MKALNTFVISCILFLIVFSLVVSAEIGEMKVIEKGWKVTYSNDADYFVSIEDKTNPHTNICLLHKNAKELKEVQDIKSVYSKDGVKSADLDKQKKKIDGKDYYGYCFNNPDEKYVKFGEHSTVVEYQEFNLIVYDCGENKSLNVTLYKNISGTFQNSGDIWVFNYPNQCKFGANDTANIGTEEYKYELIFTLPFRVYAESNIVEVYDYELGLIHKIDFTDICSTSSIGCSFTTIDESKMEVIFESGMFIDPIIAVETISSNAVSLTAMNENTIIFARSDGNITLYNYNTNGTLNQKKIVNTTSGTFARVDVRTINSTDFMLIFYSENNMYMHYQRYNTQLLNTSELRALEMMGSAVDFVDIDSMVLGDFFYIGYADDNENDADLDRYQFSNASNQVHFSLSSNIAPAEVLDNLISCKLANSTLIACMYFEDSANQVAYNFVNIQSATFNSYASGLIDGAVGEQARVSISVIDETYIGWVMYAIDVDDIFYGVKLKNGTDVVAQTQFDANAGTNSRTAMTTVVNPDNNRTQFVAGYYDENAGLINAFVFETNGTIVYQYNVGADENFNAFNILMDMYGYDDFANRGFANGTYILAYTNETGYTLLKTFWINGTLWNGEYIVIPSDNISPNFTGVSPINQTYTNNTSINFTLTATDNQNLSNGTIYIYNETGGLINVTTKTLTGNSSIFSVVYNFVVDGVYHWFVRIYDTAGNFVDTIIQVITIDTTSPNMTYETPTLPNSTIYPLDHFIINVSATDLNLSIIRINLYNSTTLIESVNDSSSPFYHNFENLSNQIYYFNATACDYNNLCSGLVEREIEIDASLGNQISFILILEQYPYLDLNVSYLFETQLNFDHLVFPSSNITITFSNGTQNWTYQMVYNATSDTYQTEVAFTESGTYTLTANSYNPFGDFEVSTIFYVAEPFYVSFEFITSTQNNTYWWNWFNSNKYINDYAYVTAELLNNPRQYDPNIEPFFLQLPLTSRAGIPVWHGEYNDGIATIKLYERGTYAIRLIDGEIIFPTDYSVPNITESYGVNTYIGQSFINGTSSHVSLLTKKDLHPFTWLFNILTVILVMICILGAVFLFFIVPQSPAIAISFGLVLPIILIILRILLYIWVA